MVREEPHTSTPHSHHVPVQLGGQTYSSENSPGVITNRQVCPFHPATLNTRNVHAPRPINPVATHSIRLPTVEHHSSSDNTLFNPAQAQEHFVYYPEQPYIAVTLPTQQPRELAQFFEHCQGLITMQPFIHFAHPIGALQHITANPLNFVNLLFQTHITISHAGIIKKYAFIRRRVRFGHPNKAVLEPTYTIHYNWVTNGWTVTTNTEHSPVG